MKLVESLDSGRFPLLAEVDPPKGPDLKEFVDTVLAIRGRVDSVVVTDGSHAIMRMTPLGPCRLLIERNVEPVMVLTGRDRNRISFQGDLLAAHALGVRKLLLAEGQDPSAGDQPMARSCADLNLELMLQCVTAMNSGRDLAGEPLAGQTDFLAGVALEVSDDINLNRRRADGIGRLVELGAHFVVLCPTYDVNIVDLFSRSAEAAEVDLFASVMMLKSVAMIRYLNNLPGVPGIPNEFLKRMIAAPVKQQAGLDIAAGFLKDLEDRCRGAVLIALGWGARLPEFLSLAGR